MTIISLSMKPLNSRRLHVMFISSSVRICGTRSGRSVRVSSNKVEPRMGGLTAANSHYSLNTINAFCTHLFTGNILQVFLHHDLPEPGFDLTLRQLSFSGPAKKDQDADIRCFLIGHEMSCGGEKSRGNVAAPPLVLTRQRRALASLRGATAGPAWRSTR